MWERLVGVLADMLELYRELLAISNKKHEVLVKARTVELDALTKQEELLIIQIGKLETVRETVLQEIAAATHIAGESVTIARLVELADEKFSARLHELWQQLSQVTGELKEINGQNTKLIDQALFFVNYNLNILTQNAIGPTYAAKGQEGQAARASKLIDRKV